MLTTIAALSLTAAAACSVAAQNTATIYAPGFDQQALQGQVVGETGGEATTYAISASPGAEDSGLAGGTVYYVDAGSSIDLYLEVQGYTVADACELHTDQGYAVCSSLLGDPTPATLSDMNFLPVEIVGTTDAAAVPSALGGEASAAAPTTAAASVNTGVDQLSSGIATIFSGADGSGSGSGAEPSASRGEAASAQTTGEAAASSSSEDSSAGSRISWAAGSLVLAVAASIAAAA